MKGDRPAPGAGDVTKAREGVGVLHHPPISILLDFWRNVYLIVAILTKESRYRRNYRKIMHIFVGILSRSTDVTALGYRRTGSIFLGADPILGGWPRSSEKRVAALDSSPQPYLYIVRHHRSKTVEEIYSQRWGSEWGSWNQGHLARWSSDHYN